MEQKEINGLIENCLNYFSNACYTAKRIDKYRSLWRNGILKFMKEKSLSIYTPAVGFQYISEWVSKEDLRHEEREKIRSIQVLDDYLNLGYIRKNTTKHVEHALIGSLGEEMQKLIQHLVSLRRSEITINDYKLYLSKFLKYLYLQGIDSPMPSPSIILSNTCRTVKPTRLILSALFVFYSASGLTDISSQKTRN